MAKVIAHNTIILELSKEEFDVLKELLGNLSFQVTLDNNLLKSKSECETYEKIWNDMHNYTEKRGL